MRLYLSFVFSEFEELAIGVLNQCYQTDKKLAHLLLTRRLDLWANKTLFAIADDAQQMSFMEQSCCQTQLNKSWSGRLAQNTPVWQVIGYSTPLYHHIGLLSTYTKDRRNCRLI